MTNKLLEALKKDGFDIQYGEKINCVDSKEENKRYYRSYSLGLPISEGQEPHCSKEVLTQEDAINFTLKNLQEFKKSPLILRAIEDPIKIDDKWSTYIRFYSELIDKNIKESK
jgi:hypothetical protein